MIDLLLYKVPKEIVDLIKLYTGEGCWRNGKYITINKIKKDDYRYLMLNKRALIKQVFNNVDTHPKRGMVWFKISNKFAVISTRYFYYWNGVFHALGYFWEMDYNQKKIIRLIY